GVEGRRQFLQRLFPPARDKPPPHQHQLCGSSVARSHGLHRVGRGDVVVRLQITSGAYKLIQVKNLVPRAFLRKSSAHGTKLTNSSPFASPPTKTERRTDMEQFKPLVQSKTFWGRGGARRFRAHAREIYVVAC